MLQEENVMKTDLFEKRFEGTEQFEFHDFIRGIDAATQWERHPLKEIVFVPASSVKADDLSLGDEEALMDSKHNLPIVACLPDGRKILMRYYLWKQIKQHHRDTCAVINDMAQANAWEDVCAHLNSGAKYLKKKVIVMTRGEKVSGWFGQFNTSWTQEQQICFVEEKMAERFTELQFVGGSYTHLFTTANYMLDTSICGMGWGTSVMDAYAAAWEEAGMEVSITKAVPMVRFVTGESGMTSIALSPYLKLDGTEIPLGPSLSVSHRGSDEVVWGKLQAFPDMSVAKYKAGMDDLKNLCEMVIYHPYSCMTHVLKGFLSSLPLKDALDLAGMYQIMYDPSDADLTCRAINLYQDVNNLISEVNGRTKSPVRRLNNMELVARLLCMDWQKLDVKTPAKLSNAAETDDMKTEEFIA